jgi:hypothetical protein
MNAPMHALSAQQPKAIAGAARHSPFSGSQPQRGARGLGTGVGQEHDDARADWSLSRLSIHQGEQLPAAGLGQGGGQPRRAPPPPAAGTCPANVTFSTGAHDVHVPLCGITNVTANTAPANIPGITWSLTAGTAQVGTGTTISNAGVISFDPAQTGGTLTIRADQPAAAGGGTCFATGTLGLHSHPTVINSTFVVGPPAGAAANYGAVFDHNFASADGNVSSLTNVAVGEQFSGVPNPTATVHVIPATPFGPFTLNTANLTPDATNNWFVTNGSLGGNHDSITIERAAVNVGQFLASASNPTPANTLPASFTLTQGLHWFCRQAAAAARWTKFADVDHVRTLRLDASGTGVEFAVSANRMENVDSYTGHPAIINAQAAPATIPPTPARARGAPAPAPSTTVISADPRPDPLPRGHQLRFAIRGNALGCTVNATTGLFTAGTRTGSVTVRVRDSAAANPNFDEVVVMIAAPAAQPAPAQPAPGQPQPGPAQPAPNPGSGATPPAPSSAVANEGAADQ